MLNITIGQVPNLVKLCKQSKNNLLIVGNPGVGKSQTINALANEHCKVTMMTGSSTYEETVNGIPRDNRETNIQDYTRPSWFVDILEWSKEHNDPEDYQILLIDEFNTADPQVLKTFLSILSERKIPTQPEPLPDDVVLVAAMNPASQNEGEELIRPMASRFLTVNIQSTIEDYKRFTLGEASDQAIRITVADKAEELEPSQKLNYLDQISPDDWQSFNPGTYHEINPRSMDNFFRAMSYAGNKKQMSEALSMAFFDKKFKYPLPESMQEIEKARRAEKIKRGSAVPTKAELEEMSTEELKMMHTQMLSRGSSGVAALANIMEILASRGESI